MLDFLFKNKEPECSHEWELVDSYKGENGFGLIGYRRIYICKKCLKSKEITYYP